MAERINTTDAEKESASWTPTGPFTIQAQVASADSTATVEVHARVDAAAPFAVVGGMRPASEAFLYCPAVVGETKIVMHGNKAGNAVKVWSDK